MEGGNKTSINLYAGIDTSTSDMLVPFGGHTFQHNWQKYQGKFLPNSLRFEKNGWAAGWNVYNFKYNNTRKKLAENVYADFSVYNEYAKTITIYDSLTSDKALAKYFIVTDTKILSGEAELHDNVIQGELDGKRFEITWDSNTHVASIADPLFNVEQKIAVDKTVTLKVTRTDNLTVDFDLFMYSGLTCDEIAEVEYRAQTASDVTWGDYTYNFNTNKMLTPEGIEVTCTPNNNNEITFNYSKVVTDEKLILRLVIEPMYFSFNNLVMTTDTAYTTNVNANTSLIFNKFVPTVAFKETRYYIYSLQHYEWRMYDYVPTEVDMARHTGTVISETYPREHPEYNWVKYEHIYHSDTATYSVVRVAGNPDIKTITAGDPYGVKITCGIPIWFSVKVNWEPIEFVAKLPNNTANGEIALYVGTGLNNKVTCINAFTGQTTVKVLTDKYSKTGSNAQYVNGLTYRFNQLLVHNTIKPSASWSPARYTINKSDVWILDEKQYSNFRNRNKQFIGSLIGDLYELKDFTFKATDYIEQNNPFNWEVADNVVYTLADISGIPSIKPVGESDVITDYDDTDILQSSIPSVSELYDLYVAHKTTTPIIYSRLITPAKEYTELYDTTGKYIGATYAQVDSHEIDANMTFWPFEYIPCFNFKDADGNVHRRVYWTDGTDIIDDMFTFVAKVLGEYNGALAKDNDPIVPNTVYSRNRLVQTYSPVYDFNKPTTEIEISKFNKAWTQYYPEVISPLEQFNDLMSIGDTRYLDYIDITVNQEVTPVIKYVTPGVYVFGKFALPFSTNANVIMYDTAGKYTGNISVYQQNKEVTDSFTTVMSHTYGKLLYNNTSVDLPYYFGSLSKITLYATDNTELVFRQVSAQAQVQSDNISFSITENTNNSTWMHGYTGQYKSGKLTGNIDSCKFSVIHNNTLFDMDSGVTIAWCGLGYAQGRLIYPVARSKSQLQDAGILKFEAIKDSEISAELRNAVWLDRDTINGYSTNMFTLECTSIDTAVDSDNKPTARIYIAIKVVDNAVLYYADDTALYYFPSVLFEDAPANTKLLQDSNKSVNIVLNATPSAYDILTDVVPTFTPANTYSTTHKFYTEVARALNIAKYIPNISGLVNELPVIVYFGGATLHFNYYVYTKQFVLIDVTGPIENDAHAKFTVSTLTGSDTDYKVNLTLQLFFNNCKAKYYYTPNAGYNVTNANTQYVDIQYKGITLKYTPSLLKIVEPKVIQKVDLLDGKHHIAATRDVYTQLSVCLPAVYDGRFDNNNVVIQFDNKEYTIDMSRVSFDNNMSVISTDIRDPDNPKVIGSINTTGQYQLLKQTWNTTMEVENYWYVDPTHILELGLSNFKLKRNTGNLDDWGGNVFEDIYEMPRSTVLTTDIIKYFVPNVCDSTRTAVFVTLQVVAAHIVVSIYDIRNKLKQLFNISIDVQQKMIGKQLNEPHIDSTRAVFNTYSVLNESIVMATAEWSSTIVGDTLIIGCHVNNNFDQWAITIDLNTHSIIEVIQGYGYVGLHGDLTGGMIPDDYFSTTIGFTGTVMPLDSLNSNKMDLDNLDAAFEVNSLQELNYIKPKVVGTAERQWYIQSELSGIVSHLTYVNNSFVKHVIPMTNKFTTIYKSGSFSSSVLGDAMVQASTLEAAIKFPQGLDVVWRVAMAALGWPTIYHLSPRYSIFSYLQQTLGQYAYVHYNSSESLEDNVQDETTGDAMEDSEGSGAVKVKKQADPVLSGTMTFDKQKISQSLTTDFDFVDAGLIALLIVVMADSLTELGNTLTSVNAEQNQTASSDIAKKYLPLPLENVGDMIAASITTASKASNSMTSVVTGLKTLDMFYSTSDKQRIFAGPGFVEHQFVADCIAQSVTDLHVDGKVQQLFWCIRGLTTYQSKLALAMEKAAAEKLIKLAEVTSRGGSGSWHGAAAMAAAIIAMGSAMLASAATVATEAAMGVLDTFMDSLTVQGIKSTVDANVHNQNLTLEATHKYGEKNEIFMWPCWGIQPGSLKYADEIITSGIKNTPWVLNLRSRQYYNNVMFNAFNPIMSFKKPKFSSNLANKSFMTANIGVGKYGVEYADEQSEIGDNYRAYFHRGAVPYYQAAVYSEVDYKVLPDDMAKVEGVERLLPKQPFRNDNCGVGEPVFAPSLIQDYVVDKRWDLSQTATYGLSQWIAIKDTKLTNCAPSNMYVTDEFCGIACPYVAIEVKRGISKAYMRPWAITPNTLAFNTTGYNTIFDNKLYHAFDGITYRLIDLVGSAGLNKNFQSFWYLFQNNDMFKRSNIAPANEILGNFNSEPTHAVSTIDPLFNQLNIGVKNKHNKTGTVSEDRDATRWSIPIFTEPVSTLPAVVKTIASSPLAVVDGVTGLVTKLITDTNADYKAPLSIDFTIGKKVYRVTEEYICSVTASDGGNTYEEIVPILGLTFIGSTPTEAYFYSKATRYYYTFTGNNLVKVDMLERFRDIQRGYWDFVNQEVVMPCLMTFKRLNPDVEDKDTETDNIIVPVLHSSTVSGELPPPLTTIFNDRSWYKAVSLPSGFAYQGPNRVIINRAVLVEYMINSIKNNFGKWSKLNKEKYTSTRVYQEKYKDIMTEVTGVDGWTYNPFVLVTSPLGVDENTDGMFEWSITFCWPIEMDLVYGPDNFATVNIAADTMTVGSKIDGRPTHVYLTKELFARADSYGYYTFTYQSKNGIGNRERLRIWSDQYIAISSITCDFKPTTTKRATILTQQVDIQHLKEL